MRLRIAYYVGAMLLMLSLTTLLALSVPTKSDYLDISRVLLRQK